MASYKANLMKLDPHTTLAQSVLDQMVGHPVNNKVGGRDGVVTKAWVADGWVKIEYEEVENE